jgi:hypothetical protein
VCRLGWGSYFWPKANLQVISQNHPVVDYRKWPRKFRRMVKLSGEYWIKPYQLFPVCFGFEGKESGWRTFQPLHVPALSMKLFLSDVFIKSIETWKMRLTSLSIKTISCPCPKKFRKNTYGIGDYCLSEWFDILFCYFIKRKVMKIFSS